MGTGLQPSGRDELALLAEEFNQLTDRLQTTEEVAPALRIRTPPTS